MAAIGREDLLIRSAQLKNEVSMSKRHAHDDPGAKKASHSELIFSNSGLASGLRTAIANLEKLRGCGNEAAALFVGIFPDGAVALRHKR